MKTAAVYARVEPEMKRSAENVLRNLGITPTEAIRSLYRQICLRGGLPFSAEIPNKRTSETLARSHQGVDIEQFDSLDELFESWER